MDTSETEITRAPRVREPGLYRPHGTAVDACWEERWLRGRDLNPRPLGYEPNELPDCSTPRQGKTDYITSQRCRTTTSSNPRPLKNDLSVVAAFAEAVCRMPPSSAACCTCFSASWRTCD